MSFRSSQLLCFTMFSVLVISEVVVPVITYRSVFPSINIDVGKFMYSGREEGEVVQVNPELNTTATVPPIPPFQRYSLGKGIEEAIRVFGKAPLLPKWLPESMKYAEVYIGPVVLICFSDRVVSDFTFDNISIEVTGDTNPPSVEELKKEELSWRTYGWNLKLIQVGDIWITFSEKASLGPYGDEIFGPSPLAIFWTGNLYYIMSAGSPLTPQDLIKIIESMTTT